MQLILFLQSKITPSVFEVFVKWMRAYTASVFSNVMQLAVVADRLMPSYLSAIKTFV